MKTVIFDVVPVEEMKQRSKRRIVAALAGTRQPSRISFASAELMFRTMTGNRWNMVRAMAGAGPMGVRELARRLKRDVKAVHTDAAALLSAGILRRTEARQIEFPYDAVHVDFVVKVA
jgi:predicted transcriptional regulator